MNNSKSLLERFCKCFGFQLCCTLIGKGETYEPQAYRHGHDQDPVHRYRVGFFYQLADAEEKANGRSGRRYVMGMKKNTKKPVVIKVGAKPKMKVIDLKEMKNEKIVAKVRAMCRQSFASCIGDAKLAEYEELEDMLRRQ